MTSNPPKRRFTRRRLLKSGLATVPAAVLAPRFASRALAQTPSDIHIARGPFQPTWDSLKAGYKAPDWFRDAKFGIWNHWTAQCVPEQGDWYARRMYLQGDHCYDHHLKTYGHPSKVGWMEINNLWKAEHWKPERLMDLYVGAGAKYFAALANHRKSIRSELAAYAARFRALQLQAIAGSVKDDEIEPTAVLVVLTGISQVISMEQALGFTEGHAETLALVQRWLDRAEPLPDDDRE